MVIGEEFTVSDGLFLLLLTFKMVFYRFLGKLVYGNETTELSFIEELGL